MRKSFVFLTLGVAVLSLLAFKGGKEDNRLVLKQVKYNKIKGAPKLCQPFILCDENNNPIFTEKSGNAYPTMLDINNDGKKELLVGDFGGGKRANVNYYENIGTSFKPVFSSSSKYLADVNNDNLHISGY